MSDFSPFIGNTGIVQGSPEPAGFYGPYRGIVTNTMDPASQNRIKAVVPQLFGNASTECDWALPCQLPGLQSIPSPGQGVWIMFEGGDINYPVYMGMWQAEPSVAPYDVNGAASSAAAAAQAAAQAASDPAGSAATALSTAEAYTDTQLSAYYPTLTISSGHLALDYSVTGSMATFMTSNALSVGVWFVTFIGQNANISGDYGYQIAQGTATASFAGTISGEVSGGNNSSFGLTNYATVSSPGTVVFQARSFVGSPVIKATTVSAGLVNATGYTALKVQ